MLSEWLLGYVLKLVRAATSSIKSISRNADAFINANLNFSVKHQVYGGKNWLVLTWNGDLVPTGDVGSPCRRVHSQHPFGSSINSCGIWSKRTMATPGNTPRFPYCPTVGKWGRDDILQRGVARGPAPTRGSK